MTDDIAHDDNDNAVAQHNANDALVTHVAATTTTTTMGEASANESDAAASAASTPVVVMAQPSQTFLRSDTAAQVPPHLQPLAYTIRRLGVFDSVYIAQMVNTVAPRDVYSMLPYTGNSWFVPTVRSCRAGESRWQLRYDWHEGLVVALGGRCVSLRLFSFAVRAAFVVLVWFALWCMLPHALVTPGGYVWDPVVLVVVSAIVGGAVCRLVQFPPLMGVLWMGVLWNNVPRLRYLTAGIDAHVFSIAAKLGLTVILLRAGYSISLKGLRPHWQQSLMLCTLPFACEGVVHSLIARPLFGYANNQWAFLQGMLCSVASPAVVVPGSLYLMEVGYGRGVSVLSLMLSAVGMEIVIGVWCGNFIIGLLFAQQSLPVAIVLGPVQFVAGALLGVGFGLVYHYVVELLKAEARRLPNGSYERAHLCRSLDFGFAIFLTAAFAMVFFGYSVNLAGGGCVMAVFFAATVAHMWSSDGSDSTSSDGDNDDSSDCHRRRRRQHAIIVARERNEQSRHHARWLAVAWDEIMMPVLFATMGAKVNVVAIFNATFFPRALACLVCSTVVRMLVVLLLLLGSRFPWRERVVVCIGYLGKASAQASMGPIAANLVADLVRDAPPAERTQYASMAAYADTVQQMTALYVMFMPVIASLGLVYTGKRLLTRNVAATAATTSAAAAVAELPPPSQQQPTTSSAAVVAAHEPCSTTAAHGDDTTWSCAQVRVSNSDSTKNNNSNSNSNNNNNNNSNE